MHTSRTMGRGLGASESGSWDRPCRCVARGARAGYSTSWKLNPALASLNPLTSRRSTRAWAGLWRRVRRGAPVVRTHASALSPLQ